LRVALAAGGGYPHSPMQQGAGKKRIVLLGATGSIGQSTLAVVDGLPEELEVAALTAASGWRKLLEQVRRYRPRAVGLTDEAAASALEEALRGEAFDPPRIYSGKSGLVRLVEETAAETVVGAISGAAGLPASIAALATGKDLALANKESMVCAGGLLNRLAKQKGRRILPIDSEHSAIFQSLLSGRPEEVQAVILTASGGPFRSLDAERLAAVTPEEALRHPTWRMGSKITIDSATLMNKALEVIEARWLFDLPPSKIRVVIHPQSIVHSLVEFVDGSIICQLGPPDMKIPIQYALTFPRRRPMGGPRLDLAQVGRLTFEAPDPVRFPSLRLAYEVLERGGTAAAVFNAANEVAVDLFLKKQVAFLRIFELVESVLSAHNVVPDPDLEQVLAADRWARDEVGRLLNR
jgi:1-deoxy-D-xylulose-5-phosphate reductoisomerase